jgi:hypothetical protein
MKNCRNILIVALAMLLGACASPVRKQDLDSWIGIPVEALDTHSFFLTVPMLRTVTASGIEIRNYANGADFSSCATRLTGRRSGGLVNANAFTSCSSNRVVCNNLFYIRDGKVIEYAPTGQCYTDETVQPQARYLRLRSP